MTEHHVDSQQELNHLRNRVGELESAARFLELNFSQTALGIVVLDHRQRLVRANQKFCDFLGYSEEELKGLHWEDVSHPSSVPENSRLYQDLLDGKMDHFTIEKRYVRKDGRVVWGMLSVYNLKIALGELGSMIAVIQDLQPVKEAQTALVHSEANLKAIVDNTHQAFVLLDPYRKLLVFNTYAQYALAAMSQKELVLGEDMFHYVPEQLNAAFLKHFQKALDGDHSLTEAKIEGKEPRWFEFTFVPVKDSVSGTNRVLVTAQDITRRKDSERRFLNLNAELEMKVAEQKNRLEQEEAWNAQAAERIKDTESRTNAVLRALPDLMLVIDRNGRFLDYSLQDERDLHGMPHQFLGLTPREVFPEHLAHLFMEAIETVHQDGEPEVLEYALDQYSERRYFEARFVPYTREKVLAIVRDTTERKQIEQLNAIQQHILYLTARSENTREILLGLCSMIEDINPGALCSVLRYDARNQTLWHLAAPSLPTAYMNAVNGLNAGPQAGSCGTAAYIGRTVIVADIETDPLWENYRTLARTHHLRACWSNPVQDRSGTVLATFAIYYRQPKAPSSFQRRMIDTCVDLVRIVLEREASEARIRKLAFYDALTGLPNRVAIENQVTELLKVSEQTGKQLAFLYMDMDNFKNVNDSLGHAAGDKLLIQVAARIRQSLPSKGLVARQSGDEFIVVIPDTSYPETTEVARRLIHDSLAPFQIDGHELIAAHSIGISLFPEDATSFELLRKHADTALYHAKHAGRNQFSFFTEDMRLKAMDRLRIETALRSVLHRHELQLHYQPIMDLQTSRVMGVEALMRWTSAELGEVPPARFIPIAEEMGIIEDMTRWVLLEVCQMNQRLEDAGVGKIPVSVNLSDIHFRSRSLIEAVAETLKETGMEPHYLDLEVTESLLMSNLDTAIDLLGELSDLGVTVSLDDFGTGYSSLTYLQRLPLDRLKVDRSFMTNLVADQRGQAVTRAVIALGHSLGLMVVAEGVEDKAQHDWLRKLNCDGVQGFLMAHPLQEAQLVEFLKEHPALGD
ncbi:sensor domain-containing protein [Deinococcus misasensis]|uniref:sensor domain-containing protein n=1 Tax=Deinococcus misasensis TaxID=392413 RepID=UPI000689CCDB|nr:EAL domain-containing protein [Deinococcus misasensis]